ncbi:MAG: iron-containing alcohol dehydrogenase, partial [Clostridiales bacterium]|nr:iron-containing alcohol dehydrogenase [Clostridiales bacterium]
MNIQSIAENLKNCGCGRRHGGIGDMRVEIGAGLLSRTAHILARADFPRKLLVVADKNTLAACTDILDILSGGGFGCKLKLFEDLRVADMRDVVDIAAMVRDEGIGGVLSVGSGSLGDICRLASFKAGVPFAIFATAPSMDGFAANSAPITENNFKTSILCHAPAVIIGDTEVLAKAPDVLKSAGFGDMLAKYIALVDWKIARIVIGEYFCPGVAAITKRALDTVIALADEVKSDSPDAAAALMEGLVLSGLAMTLAGATRPASGAEHIVSHFWEIMKLQSRQISDFHGRKVAVATLLISRLYHHIADAAPHFGQDATNWHEVYAAYGAAFRQEIENMNNPTITAQISPQSLAKHWAEIRDIVKSELPRPEALESLMKRAGGATTIADIGIEPDLAAKALKFHPYMRHRVNLSRLIPMLGAAVDYGAMVTAKREYGISPFFRQVYAIVEQIPYGRVMSYGQIARELGHPRGARQVGWAMRYCPEHLPWHRVVKADGTIAGGQYAQMRRQLLEAEDV